MLLVNLCFLFNIHYNKNICILGSVNFEWHDLSTPNEMMKTVILLTKEDHVDIVG